jgi:hypothetical protein
MSDLKTAYPGLIWVIEVEYKRRKGKPVEAIAITTGGMLQALLLAKECADKLKVPQSWVNPVLYRKCSGTARLAGRDSAGKETGK